MTDPLPHIRSATTCPLCRGAKDRGLVACWDCYREQDLRRGNPQCEAIIANHERALGRMARAGIKLA
jgi:hypothetical protein